MITIVTGTVGLDKAAYLNKVEGICRQNGKNVKVCHIGQLMYNEAPDIAPGRILDLPIGRLRDLRSSVFKDVINLAKKEENLIVNTHATFRWKHGLFPAFDFDILAELNADLYINLIDNVDAVHSRLVRDHQIDHSLKDLLVWREEESLGTEMMMLACREMRHLRSTDSDEGLFGSMTAHQLYPKYYALALGHNNSTTEMFYRMMFCPNSPKAYLSFPMTHVVNMPDILAEIDAFRKLLTERMIVFDPADLDEHRLSVEAMTASMQGRKVIELEVLGETMSFDVSELMQVSGDIHSQIYARDFMLIDQADMIVSYIPRLADGRPGLSSGVERELQHAHEATREVYVIWRPESTPSPFITETATRVFSSVDEAIEYFIKKKYIKSSN